MNKRQLGTLIIGFLLFLTLLVPFIPDRTIGEIEFDDDLDIMTYNLHFGIDPFGNYAIDGILELLRENKPDIVFLQEIALYSPINGYINMWADLVELTQDLGYSYHYASKGDYYLFNGIISRLPLSESLTVRYQSQDIYLRSLIRSSVKMNGDKFTVIVTHLSHSSSEKGTSTRLDQINELLSTISEISGPLIFGGDFNLLMNETGYDFITRTYKDSWNETFDVTQNPGYTSSATEPKSRIDYLFTSDVVSINSCIVANTLASDHLPLQCQFDV